MHGITGGSDNLSTGEVPACEIRQDADKAKVEPEGIGTYSTSTST
jgi:hypothetical protein